MKILTVILSLVEEDAIYFESFTLSLNLIQSSPWSSKLTDVKAANEFSKLNEKCVLFSSEKSMSKLVIVISPSVKIGSILIEVDSVPAFTIYIPESRISFIELDELELEFEEFV
jgi:hypothetical protein